MKFNVCLMGRHANRTPLAYEPYRVIGHRYFNFVDSPQEADYLIFGFRQDIFDYFSELEKQNRRDDSCKLVLVSEEPLWDTLWGGDYRTRQGLLQLGSALKKFTYINHFTSSIFNFSRLPYFITTSDDFFIRYGNLFHRNARLGKEALRVHFQSTRVRTAFFCERRVESRFIPREQDEHVFGLNVFRSHLAEALAHLKPSLRVGRGWDTLEARQSLPDWHLAKLATLDCQALFVSAIENTHVINYITEKPFDALAVLGVPIYVARPEHRINELFLTKSFLNVTPNVKSAVQIIESFEISNEFLDAYVATQNSLAALFSSPDILQCERERLIKSLAYELAQID